VFILRANSEPAQPQRQAKEDSGWRMVALISIYGNQEVLQAVTSEKAFLAFLAFMKS
jgi:hypothetical protein